MPKCMREILNHNSEMSFDFFIKGITINIIASFTLLGNASFAQRMTKVSNHRQNQVDAK